MTKPYFAPHAVDTLRTEREKLSTRVFNARGISVKRCSQCLLSEQTCICSHRHPQAKAQLPLDVLLLMHKEEVFKPTNTGRLMADLFPDNTYAHCWDRTQPDPALLAFIQDPQRACYIVFPTEGERKNEAPTMRAPLLPETFSDQRLTLIVLDGTWKQARKMFRQSQWLQHLPVLDLKHLLCPENGLHPQLPPPLSLGNYQVREAPQEGQLATAEAAAVALQACGQSQACQQLLGYFAIFNEHYVAMRMNRQPQSINLTTPINDTTNK